MTPIFSMLIIFAVVISTILLIIVMISLHKPRRYSKMMSRFEKAAAEAGASIAKQQLVGKRVIGVDIEKAKLMFLTTSGKRNEGYFIDLHDVASCDIHREYGGVTFDKHSRKSTAVPGITKIALYLFYKNGAKRVVLPFYDKTEDNAADVELRSAQAVEWKKVISSIVKSNRKMPYRSFNDEKSVPAFTTYIDAA